MNHCHGVRLSGRRATFAILSVTVSYVNPGPTIFSGPGSMADFSNASIFKTSTSLDLGIRVPQTRQISSARPRVQLFQETVVSLLHFQSGHLAIGIVDIAKNDRLRGTGLRAGRYDLAIFDPAILF